MAETWTTTGDVFHTPRVPTMPLTAGDIIAFAGEFQRLATEFSVEAGRLLHANLPEKLSPEEVEGREDYDRLLQRLDTWTRHQLEVSPQQREEKRRTRNEDQSLTRSQHHVVRASRIILSLLDQTYLKELAPLKVNAAALQPADEKALAAFWWEDVIPLVASLDQQKSSVSSRQRVSRFEQSAISCRRISEMLMNVQPSAAEHQDLSVKGLVDASGESEGTIRSAADAANVRRPHCGQHGQQFSVEDVYRIAVRRGESSRMRKEARGNWNKLLKRLGLPTLDEPRRAFRKTPKQ